MARRRRAAAGGGRRDFPRTARVGELVREIVGEELEAIGDERLEGVVLTSVSIDRDLRVAEVFWDSRYGPEADDEILEALDEHRNRLRTTINAQAHLRRTPDLVFRPDPGVRAGEHIDAVLAELDLGDDEGPGDPEQAGGDPQP